MVIHLTKMPGRQLNNEVRSLYRVLLVDDMEISRRQVRRLNLWNGETCFSIAAEAQNGHEALNLLKREHFDLLITDIKMPKIDGIELLKEAAEGELCHCIVLLSDYEDFSFAKQGILHGAFDYLGKPPEYDKMFDMLSRVEQFLIKKNKENELVKNLEERLEEKIDDAFPSAELELLIDAIMAKRPDASVAASGLGASITALFENDTIKIGAALKKSMAELISQLNEHFDWLHRFVDCNKYSTLDFIGMEDIQLALESFSAAVGELIHEIGKLEYGNAQGQLEYKICHFVLDNVDNEVSIGRIAEALFMNRKYISEVFRQRTGELLIDYITRVKMARAARLLFQGSLKTYEIALQLGYRDTEYFSRLFKKHKGLSPSEYRNRVTD
jgi:two-component system response regulator YesN